MRAIVFLCLLGAALAQTSKYSWDGLRGSTRAPYRDLGNVCLTDQASCGCCLMQQQMHRMEQFFNLSIESLQNDLTSTLDILNSVKASRSAFSVALTNERQCLGTFREVQTVAYKHVFINLGNSYDVASGTFTAPRSGVYSFALTVYSDAGSTGNDLAACVKLMVNGVMIARPNDNNRQDQEDSATIVMALQLKAGDRVYVTLPPGCFLCDNNSHFNTFTGFLLYATD